MEKLHSIKLSCPDGWEPIEFRLPVEGDHAWLPGWKGVNLIKVGHQNLMCFIMKRIKKQRIVIEETDEDNEVTHLDG